MSVEYFDVERLKDAFDRCLVDDGDIQLVPYLEAYRELLKFCKLMGSVFTFISAEIESKSLIIKDHMDQPNGEHFVSLKKMMKHEVESNLLHRSKYVSGCRTLLRLHRGMDFIRTFFEKILSLNLSDSTSSCGFEAYNATLAKHHGWLIRQGAFIAMYLLPTKKSLLEQLFGNDYESALEQLPSVITVANEVFTRTHTCYKNNNLLDLP